MYTAGEVQIPVYKTQLIDGNVETVPLWRVYGCPMYYFPTKIAAEKYAREIYPNDSPETRYTKITCVEFEREVI